MGARRSQKLESVALAQEGRFDVEYVYYVGQFRLRNTVGATRHQPFLQLIDLVVSLNSKGTVLRLVPVLAGLSSLALRVERGDEQSIDTDVVLTIAFNASAPTFLGFALTWMDIIFGR
jgi:hypothetical protein